MATCLQVGRGVVGGGGMAGNYVVQGKQTPKKCRSEEDGRALYPRSFGPDSFCPMLPLTLQRGRAAAPSRPSLTSPCTGWASSWAAQPLCWMRRCGSVGGCEAGRGLRHFLGGWRQGSDSATLALPCCRVACCRTNFVFIAAHMQGIQAHQRFTLTDPALCTADQRYGKSDLGQDAISAFLAAHTCCAECIACGCAGASL